IGKSTGIMDVLAVKIAERKAAGEKYLALYTVPEHKLSGEIFKKGQDRGLAVASLHGRSYEGKTMCLDLPAVQEALKAGAPVEEAVCKSKGRSCAFYDECAFQAQKKLAASADLVVAAHNILEHQIPKEI